MLKQYNAYSKEPRDMQDQGYHNDSSLPVNKDACIFMSENGEYWQPWKKFWSSSVFSEYSFSKQNQKHNGVAIIIAPKWASLILRFPIRNSQYKAL